MGIKSIESHDLYPGLVELVTNKFEDVISEKIMICQLIYEWFILKKDRDIQYDDLIASDLSDFIFGKRSGRDDG
ncbi:MAG: hypothetical protein GQ477_05740 [Nanohaloarchaea archaeon]|nr:hypothetical protein [Candidatus Nanohaloarchaea archaeon]